MARFETRVHRVSVEPHPNADRMEIARVEGYTCCIAKGALRTGDLAAYIPDGGLVPETLLEAMGLAGKLAGPQANRVKPIVLRGVLSQGLIIPARRGKLEGRTVREGDEVSTLLGVVKYEPEPPAELLGTALPAHGECLDFDVEDLRRYPHIIAPGEPVVLTEKLHGVMTCLAIDRDGAPVVTSKGLTHKGLKFDIAAEENARNTHVRMWRRHSAGVAALHARLAEPGKGVYLLGEIIGTQLQDRGYDEPGRALRAFDIFIGTRRSGRWLDPDESTAECARAGIKTVPEIARLPYHWDTVCAHAEGPTRLGRGRDAREGVVLRPERTRTDPRIGRVILKMVSGAHLTRRKATEYS